MARRKPTKEEAKRRIDELPIIPNIRLPLGGPSLGELAKAFVDEDPLGRTGPGDVVIPNRPTQGPAPATATMMAMVNDPQFKLSPDAVDLINNDSRMVANTGFGLVEVPGQFDRSRILPRKRARRKTKTDKKMSKALREANARLRTKNGKLRKGKTQADVMRLAHRLRRKM